MHRYKLTDLNLDGVKSISNLIRLRVETSPHENAFSYWKWTDESKLTTPTLHTDNWQQFNQRFRHIAQYMQKSNFNKIGIFLPTSYSWVLVDAACLQIGATSLVYHNAWQEAELCHAINIEIPDVIVCCEYLIDILTKSLAELNINIPIILVDVPETHFFEHHHTKPSKNDNNGSNDSNKCNNITQNDNNNSNKDNINLIKIDIFNNNQQYIEEKITIDNSEHAHSVAFTSGSGGTAKAVLLQQYSLLKTAIESYQTVGFNAMNSTMFHWMPLSHVFGRVGIYIGLVIKAHSYFSRGITHFVHDIQLVKPSLLFAVPKVMSRLQSQIKHGVAKKPKYIQNMINIFEKLGNFWQKLPCPLSIYMHQLQKLLFKPIHKQLGGRLQVLVVGGAPVCKVQKRYFEALGIRVCEGFGMTETAGVVSVQPYYAASNGCGKMLQSVEASFSEQGELLLKGDILLKEYLKNTEKVKPWFNTGDVAKITDNGYLHIIGRTKEIIITENGENVHPSKIEDLITHHKYIEDVCIVGDNQTSLLALLNIDAKYINAENLHQEIKQHLHNINLTLPRFERVYHYISVSAFSQNGLLTVTHKKKRQAICAYHKAQIDEYYNKLKNNK